MAFKIDVRGWEIRKYRHVGQLSMPRIDEEDEFNGHVKYCKECGTAEQCPCHMERDHDSDWICGECL